MILQQIQQELEAPKNQYNDFGKFYHRNCEGILQALKPILAKYHAAVVLTDEIVSVSGRVYVKSTATLKTEEGDFSADSFARETEERKGMDPAQVTGSASSYARKYALSGLFAIDDNKDPDGQPPAAQPSAKAQTDKPTTRKIWSEHVIRINQAQTEEELVKACGGIKTELGKDYPLYAADCVAHYQRRSAEIKQERGQ